MTKDDRPTLDYSPSPPRRITVWGRLLVFGRWLSTPRSMGAQYLIMLVLSIIALVVALLIRWIVFAISGS